MLSLGTGTTIAPVVIAGDTSGYASWLGNGAQLMGCLMDGSSEISTSLLAADLRSVSHTPWVHLWHWQPVS